MKHIEKSITINAPVQCVYNQWTHFEDYPQFVPGHITVQQMGDRDVLWKTRVWGVKIKWRMVIEERVRDRLITWHGTVRHPQSGSVTFEAVGQDITKVTVSLEYQVRGWMEKVLDAFGVVSFRLGTTIRRFKKFMEAGTLPVGSRIGNLGDGITLPECAAMETWTLY